MGDTNTSKSTSLWPAGWCHHALITVSAVVGLIGPAHAGSVTRTSAFEYDATTGLVTKEIIEPGNSDLCVVTVHEYDSFGNRTKSTTRNCNGSIGSVAPHNSEATAPAAGSKSLFATRTVSATYSADGRFPIKNTNALNQSEDGGYNARLGVPTYLIGPNGRLGPNALVTATWAYDSWGRKVFEGRADKTGTRWTYEYCSTVTINGTTGTASCPTIAGAVGAYVITVTPLIIPYGADSGSVVNGPYSQTFYDGLGRVIRVVTQGFDGTATGGATTAKLIYQDTEYNARGLASRKSRPYFADAITTYWTEYTYDTLGRLVQEKSPDGNISKVEYAGLVTKSTNAKNQTRTETKNLIGQLVTVSDALNNNLVRNYDELGNLVKTTDALGNVITLEYDLKGRKTKMVDPDMGTWTYVYNSIGELVQQTDAKAQTTSMTYDVLGRLTVKQEPSLNSNWYYDQYKDGSVCAKGIGKLCEVTSDNGYARKHAYDSLGRAQSTTTSIGGVNYTSSISYVDDTSSRDHARVKDITYPTGTKLAYVYTPLGFTQKVVNAANTASVYWRQDSVDAEGHILQQTYGNNIVTVNTFDPKTGQLINRQAGTAGSGTYQVQNATYGYDAIGNLTSQSDTPTSQSMTYGYDELNRLKNEVRLGSAVASPTAITWGYNEIGNITGRSDVGTYAYPASGATSVRPHALSSVTGTVNGVVNPTYGYDANGNITSTAGRSVTWTSFNKVSSITAINGSKTTVVALQYDAENERVKETVTQNGTPQKTVIYLNPGAGAGLFYEEETTPTGGTKQRHYVNAGGSTIGVLTYDVAATKWTTQYWHKDQLGSTVSVTDQVGAVTESMAYEPFGKRRNINGLTDLLGTLAPSATSRGFTGHEMMDEVGLVNMNGRIYDPATGRFLSADPIIQESNLLQSYNRYSYVNNNPLFFTDPTGYKKLWQKKWFKQAVAIGVAVWTGGAVQTWYLAGAVNAAGGAMAMTGAQFAAASFNAAVVGGAAGGFTSGLVANNGHLKSGVQGGLTGGLSAGLFYAAGSVGEAYGSEAHYAGHAVAGCVSSAASGGDCATGAIAQVASLGIQQATDWATKNEAVAGFTSATLGGGVASHLMGGSFADGAKNGAYGYVYNFLSHASYSLSSGELSVTDADTGASAAGRFKSGTERGLPVTEGEYDILQGANGNFRLERRDGVYGNDYDATTGQQNIRLHGPGNSFGCVTACSISDWAPVEKVVSSTTPKKITVNTYKDFGAFLKGYNPGIFRVRTGTEQVNWYGTLKVTK